MLKVVVNKNAGRKLLVLGLDGENIRRLQNDEPILFDGSEIGLDGWEVSIVGGEDYNRAVAHFGAIAEKEGFVGP